MQSKPILIALSLVCLLCIVAVGKLAGEIAHGLTDSADTGSAVGYAVSGLIFAVALFIAVSTWHRRVRAR